MSYSTDLRSRVLELVDKGKSPKEIALLFKISRVTFFLEETACGVCQWQAWPQGS